MFRIIAFQACRHGTGCSHLVANLAVLLMQAGYRVGLLDTDPRGGGIRTLFGLDNVSTAGPQSYWWLRFNPEHPQALRSQAHVYGTCPPQQQTGIYLPSEHHPGKISQQLTHLQQYYGITNPSDALTHLGQELRLDYLLLDTQPTLDEENLLSLALADTIAVLLQLDNYDFQRIAVLLEIIQKLNTQNTWLIPSQVLPLIDTQAVAAKLTNTYQLEVGAILPLSEDMVRLASGGLFCLHHPQHDLTKVMMGFAQKLAQVSPRNLKSAEPPRQQRRGQPLMGVLDLPPLNRQVLTAIIRQGGVSSDDLVKLGLGSI
ncbi:MAG: AAA family ATPase [Cyanobacteria bacterium]|nr:AAA family ATPase [Cyanobacteriota bacterium]MDA0866187.1 AAA family ATPase [Cyanobacteriota bacterium]